MRGQLDFRKHALVRQIVFTLALFAILWLRQPDSLLKAQFWAEDGGVFFREHVLFGFWGTITRPYSGYLHVIPRLITAALSVLPARWAPLGFNLSALLIESVSCSAFFWPCFRKMIPADALRATCCIVIASSIVAGSELVGTLCNVQWYLCILSVLLIVITATTTAGEIALTLLQVSIALTAPVTLLFTPFLLLRVKNNPTRLRIRPAIHLVAIFLQAWIMRESVAGARPILKFNALFIGTLGSGLTRCVLSPVIGAAFSRKDSAAGLFMTMAVALIVSTVLLTLLIPKLRGTPAMTWFLGASYLGVGSLAAALWGRGILKEFLTLEGLRYYTAERYFFVGACMFVFCLALTAQTFVRSQKGAALVLAAAFVLGAIHNFPADRLIDKHWQENAPRIEAWQAARKRHEKVPTLRIPINPNLELVLD